MTRELLAPRVRRRTIEPVLAILTVGLAASWILEPAVVFDAGATPAVARYVVVPATLLAPGLLAVSVLGRAVRHGLRLASSSLGSRSRIRDGDTALVRIGGSVLYGGLAASTLWWVVGSVYVSVADVGGVMLAPVVAVVVGSVLSVLLVVREGVRRVWGRLGMVETG
ncbi:hypothetical protein JCM17823_05790 [Halorubrum gandharaense]